MHPLKSAYNYLCIYVSFQSDVVDRKDLNTPRKREIETAVASPNQTQIVPSVNRAGRDVYYPPGHEMTLTKREEMHAGSQAGVSLKKLLPF